MSKYVILGASGDMGISYIKHLDEIGVNDTIIAFYNNSESLQNLITNNINLIVVKCDLSDPLKAELCLKKIVAEHNDITHFISFAYGKLKYDRITAFSSSDIEKNFRIQITSVCSALSNIIPIMKKRKFGRIILLTSVVTIGKPPVFMSEYTMLKYTLLGMIKSYAVECVKYGITVNGVAPSLVDTKLWNGLPDMIKEMNIKNHPLKRTVSMGEVNNCIDFLASENSGFITGENINISGGESI